ncbi:MAG: rhodanese-like domain-containing protein [Bacteroidales bacterium]|jgi:rhodanese-related sulfurtransferase|nr:rhodanese-like domain-containing protein [Bacteroidales bacterium]
MFSKKIIISTAAIIVLLLLAVIFFGGSEARYTQSSPDALEQMVSGSHSILIQDAISKMNDQGETRMVFVDIRNSYEFAKGSIPKAINIPAADLLNTENLEWLSKLKDAKASVILFGITQSEANAPCIILRQIGYENVYMLAGGKDQFFAVFEADSTMNVPINAEVACTDFAAAIKKLSETVESTDKVAPKPKPVEKVVPVPVQHTRVVEGGC